MATWTRKPQEQEGTYHFSGQFYVTSGIREALSDEEIVTIYLNVRSFAEEQNGIDYLQTFTDEQGRKLFFIDQLNREMIQSGQFKPEHNYCTLMFAHEY